MIPNQPKGSGRAHSRSVGKVEASSQGVKIGHCRWMEWDSVRPQTDTTKLLSTTKTCPTVIVSHRVWRPWAAGPGLASVTMCGLRGKRLLSCEVLNVRNPSQRGEFSKLNVLKELAHSKAD